MFETPTKVEEVKRLGTEIKNAVLDGKTNAERLAKKARYAAEDYKSDAEYQIKKKPFETLAIAFVAGAAIAFIAGYLAGKPHRANS